MTQQRTAAIKNAVITDCLCYRTQLYRAEHPESHLHGVVAWVLNNPSMADHEQDDPTVRRMWAFTLAWGFSAMGVFNINPYRATDPKDAVVPPLHIQEVNDGWLRTAMSCSIVVCGWGDKGERSLIRRALGVMHPMGPLSSLRVTKQGNPQHPLYLPGDLKPEPWNPGKWLN